jgi:hypothetical protein
LTTLLAASTPDAVDVPAAADDAGAVTDLGEEPPGGHPESLPPVE